MNIEREHNDALMRAQQWDARSKRDVSRAVWQELWEAAMDMAQASYVAGTCQDAESLQASHAAAKRYARAHSQLEICYDGVRTAHCHCCDRPRRMSEPREWEAEIVANGGPRLTAECKSCGSTIEVHG